MRVLRTRGFRLLLAGEAVNSTGNWVAVIAIWGFAAFRFDAGASDLALLFVVLSIPGALFGPLLGVPIDRLGPRRALILANLLGCANALALTQADSYTAVILLALPLGLIEALAAASLDALPPRLVADEDLVTANALLGGARDFAIISGPAIAAVVNSQWGFSAAFVADAITFLIGAAAVWPLRPDRGVDADERDTTWRELRAGLRLARRTDGLRWTLSVAASVYLLWGLFGVLEPLYVRDVLHESDTVFASLQIVFGIGLVGTGLALAAIGDRIARPRSVALATIFSGATAALYVGTESLAVAFVGVFLWGTGVALFYTPSKTLLQRYSPLAFHGRILSLNQSLEPMASMVVTPIAAVSLGAISVSLLGVLGGTCAIGLGFTALRASHRLPPVPRPRAADASSGSSHDGLTRPGPAPG